MPSPILTTTFGLTPILSQHKPQGDDFAITTTLLGELYYGVYASQRVAENLSRLAAFVSQVAVYDFDADSAEEFGKILAEQRVKGRQIPTADAQIAAIARLHNLTVLTNDDHFSFVDGVAVENWLV